jgi:hypothetical protein
MFWVWLKFCKVCNIANVDRAWAGRKVLFVVYVAKVLRWFNVHYRVAMVGVPQGAMRVASQIWQVVLASQTLQVFCFGPSQKGTICSSAISTLWQKELMDVFSMFYLVIGGCGCTLVVMPPSALDHLSMYLWSIFPKFCPRCEHIIIYLGVPIAIHSEEDDDDYGTHKLEKTQHLFCYVTQFGGDSPWNHIHTFHCQDSSSLKISFESL